MKTKEHKKIGQLKRRIQRLCNAMQATGIVAFTVGLLADQICWSLGWAFHTGIQWAPPGSQLMLMLAGAFLFCVGFYVRR